MADQQIRQDMFREVQGVLFQLDCIYNETMRDDFTEKKSNALQQASINLARQVSAIRQSFIEEFQDEIPLSRPSYEVFTPQVRVYYVHEQLDCAYHYLSCEHDEFQDRIIALRHGYNYFLSAVGNLEQIIHDMKA